MQRIAVLDFETTGLDPAVDRACSLGVVNLVLIGGKWKTAGLHEWTFDPGREVDPGAAWVNGLSWNLLRGLPTFAGVAREILHVLDGGPVAAYNASFDMGFLRAELEAAEYDPRICPPAICIKDAYIRYREAKGENVPPPDERGYVPGVSLDRALAEFAIPGRVKGAPHGALEDARLAAALLVRLHGLGLIEA